MDDRGSKDYRNAKETLKDIEKYCKASDKCKKENGVYIFSTKEEFDKYDSLFKKVGIRDKIKLDYTKPSSTFYSTGSGFFTKTDKEENKVVDKGISTQKTGGKSYTSDFGYIEPKSECGLYAEKCKFWTTVNWATMGLVVGGTMGAELIGGPGTVEKIVTESAIGKGIQKGVDKAVDFLTKKPEVTSGYEQYAIEATKNTNSNTVMLGKYSQDGISYINEAQIKGSTYFDLGTKGWNEAVSKVGEQNMWEINRKFLEQQIQQGKEFYLSHNPETATGYFKQEVDFLMKNGFKFIKEGSYWKAIK